YISREISGWRLYSFARVLISSGYSEEDYSYYENYGLRMVVHATNSNPSITKIPTSGWVAGNQNWIGNGEPAIFSASGTLTITGL
ncbi:MAG: hypothetical protein EB023_05670, partial [Flavobacteriia bacterium]|nr:hypothetical protein [Flavobacteriia bacterium]